MCACARVCACLIGVYVCMCLGGGGVSVPESFSFLILWTDLSPTKVTSECMWSLIYCWDISVLSK